MTYKLIIFLVLNFAALGLGSLLMGQGSASEWYQHLNKAPWTPPGWTFGAAWTTIMICFSFYMAYAWETSDHHSGLIALFMLQWILNVSWNPVFFRYHQSFIALILIVFLTILVGFIFINYLNQLKGKSIFILPYFLWLLIATSLNAYITIKN